MQIRRRNSESKIYVSPAQPIRVEYFYDQSENGIFSWYKNNQQLAERGKNFTIREDPLNNNDRVIHFRKGLD